MSARVLFSGAVACLLVVVGVLGIAGCRADTTSVFAEVRFDDALTPTQLTFVVTAPSGQSLPEVTRPEEPGVPLESPQSLRLLLPDAFGDAAIAVTAIGRREGAEVARDMRLVTPRAGEEVPLQLDLSSPAESRCGPLNPCAPGLRCVNDLCVCDAESCPSGCCDESGCRARSASTCGAAGASCFACDERSDGCNAEGACACGNDSACRQGQRCVGGTCICDGQSCNGCCDGDECRPGDDSDRCGAGGIVCQPCGNGDTCKSGVCGACTPGECDGCCSGSRCLNPSLGACGASGVACMACEALKADNCSPAGLCRCGTGMPCGDGRQCVEGQCLCTPESCAGCCAGNTCVTGTSDAQCGSGGEACGACRNGNRCVSGECRCGTKPACSGACVLGGCVGG